MPEVRGASSVATASPQRPGDWLDTGLLLLAGALLLALGLGGYPLWDPGEGRNAQTAREMAAAGRWLVPLLYGEPYDHKPAPFFDLLRGFQAMFGPGETALRLPSVLATLGSLLLLHRFARARADRRTAALAGIIFLTSPEVVALARFCNFDATLSFFVTAAIVAWLGWLDSPRRRFPWHAYVAMGLGVLVKGPVAALLPVLIAAGCAYRRGVLRSALESARPVLGAGLVAALVAPWIVPATIVDPHYVKTFLLHHNLERYLSSHFEHAHGVLFYLPVILGGLFPWSLLLPVAALADTRRGLATDALIWAGTIILFFSLGQSKLATYVLPAFPALALWLAIALNALAVAPRERTRRFLDGAIVVWATLLILFPVAALAYVSATYPELYRAVAWSLPLPLLGWFGARSLRVATPRPLAVCVVFAVSNAVLVASFYHGAAPLISPIASDAAIASFARRRAPQASIIGYRVQPASLAYYSDQPVRRTKEIEDVRAAASKGPLLVVTRRRYADNLRAAGIPLYELLDTRRHLLYATVPVS